MGMLPLRSSLHIVGNSQVVQVDAVDHGWFLVIFLQDTLLQIDFILISCYYSTKEIHFFLKEFAFLPLSFKRRKKFADGQDVI